MILTRVGGIDQKGRSASFQMASERDRETERGSHSRNVRSLRLSSG